MHVPQAAVEHATSTGQPVREGSTLDNILGAWSGGGKTPGPSQRCEGKISITRGPGWAVVDKGGTPWQTQEHIQNQQGGRRVHSCHLCEPSPDHLNTE
jgi:hypothetical protein